MTACARAYSPRGQARRWLTDRTVGTGCNFTCCHRHFEAHPGGSNAIAPSPGWLHDNQLRQQLMCGAKPGPLVAVPALCHPDGAAAKYGVCESSRSPESASPGTPGWSRDAISRCRRRCWTRSARRGACPAQSDGICICSPVSIRRRRARRVTPRSPRSCADCPMPGERGLQCCGIATGIRSRSPPRRDRSLVAPHLGRLDTVRPRGPSARSFP